MRSTTVQGGTAINTHGRPASVIELLTVTDPTAAGEVIGGRR